MAIFSQNDAQTQIDFRNYNLNKPNRYVPYKLPKLIETKLLKLMNVHKLNNGSIDLILNSKGEYVYLEVNPVGQFSFLSNSCNYHIEKLIATKLLNGK